MSWESFQMKNNIWININNNQRTASKWAAMRSSVKKKEKKLRMRKKQQTGNVLWRKGSFLVAFGDFFNLEAILINCVYCPKHSETKAGNGWIPVSLWLCFSHTTPIVNTHTHPETQNYGCMLVQTHTHAHTIKRHTLRSTKDISADKKTFRRCERELRKAVPFSFLWKSPSQTHTISSSRHVSSSLISVNTMCLSSVDAAWVCVPPVPVDIKPATHPFP